MIEFLEENTTLNGLYIETDNKLIKVEKESFPTIEGFELAMKKSSEMNCNNKVVFYGYIPNGDINENFKICIAEKKNSKIIKNFITLEELDAIDFNMDIDHLYDCQYVIENVHGSQSEYEIRFKRSECGRYFEINEDKDIKENLFYSKLKELGFQIEKVSDPYEDVYMCFEFD